MHDEVDDMLEEDSDMEDESSLDQEDEEHEAHASAGFKGDRDVATDRHNGPPKTRIVVTDAAYRTWYALIYYLYTDVIIFAPLSSSFITHRDSATPAPSAAPNPMAKSHKPTHKSNASVASIESLAAERGVQGRRQWLETWKTDNKDQNGQCKGPLPCSAKAIYRLADVSATECRKRSLSNPRHPGLSYVLRCFCLSQKLDLAALRQRAFQHIISQLDVQNCPFEVFTNFTATYEEIRKVRAFRLESTTS